MHFDPPSRKFSNRFVFDENAQRSVDGRPKYIEMLVFLNENALDKRDKRPNST